MKYSIDNSGNILRDDVEQETIAVLTSSCTQAEATALLDALHDTRPLEELLNDYLKEI